MFAANTRRRPGTAARVHQRGVASIEFALVFMLLFVVMYGLVTFGTIFYTQQAVSRAAEDGARAVMLLPQPLDQNYQNNVRQVVFDSLARSLIIPASERNDPTKLASWFAANVTVKVDSCPDADKRCVVVVTYDYEKNNILPSVQVLDTVPARLESSATATLGTS